MKLFCRVSSSAYGIETVKYKFLGQTVFKILRIPKTNGGLTVMAKVFGLSVFKKIYECNQLNFYMTKYKICGVQLLKRICEIKPHKTIIKYWICIFIELKIERFIHRLHLYLWGMKLASVPIKQRALRRSKKRIIINIVLPKCDNPLVSIIVPVYNQYRYTMQCLNSLAKVKESVPFEVIIADDGSKDKTKKIEKHVKNATIIHNSQNLGYIGNCNNAAKRARGRYIYFLNNDTIVTDGWLSAMLRVFDIRENVGVVGSKIFNADGTLQECGVLMFSNIFHNKFTDEYGKGHINNYVRRVDYVSGCSFLTPKELFDKIGGFDKNFAPAYCDDPDYCLFAREFGYDTYVQPASQIIHFGGITYMDSSKELMKRNNALLRKKWQAFFDSRVAFGLQKETSDLKRAPVILIVDDRLPYFDRHAGAKTIFQFCQLFIKMGMNVKFCPLMGRTDVHPYCDVLAEMGIEVINGAGIEEWIDNHMGYIDYIMLSRPQIAERFTNIKALRARGVQIMYYGHDVHHLRMQREQEFNPKSTEDDVEQMRTLEAAVIDFCDVAFYPSVVEKEYLERELGVKNVCVVPPYIYDDKLPVHADWDDANGLIFVGSVHGPNADGLRWFLDDVFPRVIERIPDIVLSIVGETTDEFAKMCSKNVKICGLLSVAQLDALYAKTRLAIAPLRYGAGIKGKVIDALYHRVPVATTTIGAEGITAPTSILGIADSAQAYADLIVKMYNEQPNKDVNALFERVIKDGFSFHSAQKVFEKYIDVTLRDNK